MTVLGSLLRPVLRSSLYSQLVGKWGGVRFDLYLDSIDGDDGNDGLTAATALQTPSALLTAMGSTANLRIGTRYGSVFDETLELTSSHTGTLIDAYGNAADGKPLWRCDDAINAGDFSLAAGRTNVYAVNLTVETDAFAAEWPGIWEDGVPLSLSAVDLSANEGKPGTIWHGTVADDSTITLYVHPYDSTNPTSDGKEYRAAKRKGLNAYAAEDVTIRNQQGRRNYTSYGSITGGRGCLIEDCDAYEGNTHNIFYRPGPSASGRTAVLRRVLARDTYRPADSPTLFIGYEATAPAASEALLDGCRAELTYNYRLPKQIVTNATSASPCVITIAGHGLANGDIIIAEGFTAPWDVLNGQRFVVASAATDTFALQTMNVIGNQVNYSTAALAAYSGNGGTIRLYPYQSNVAGFYTHAGGATSIAEITYSSCETDGCGNPIAAANTAITNIGSGTFQNFSLGFQSNGGVMNVTDAMFTNVPAITAAIAGRSGAVNTEFNVTGGFYRLNTTGSFHLVHSGSTLRLDGTTCYGFNTLVRCEVANCTLDLQNNEYVPEARQFNPYNIGASATGLTFTSDFNDFNGASANIIYLGTTYAAFADYKTASGQDANSTP